MKRCSKITVQLWSNFFEEVALQGENMWSPVFFRTFSENLQTSFKWEIRFNVAVTSISLYHYLSPQSTHHIKRKSVARVSSKTASYHSQSPSRRLVDNYDNGVGNDGNDGNDDDIDVYYDKHEGRVTLPKGWIFGKVPKGGGVIFNTKDYVADFGPLDSAFWAWNFWNAIWFSKNGGGD